MRAWKGPSKRRTRATWMCNLTLTLLLAAISPARAEETAGTLFQAGLYEEQVHGELDAAIKLYQRILDKFPIDRPVAAKALLHIGLCREKLGQQEALEAYQKLVEQYPEQQQQVREARERIARLSRDLDSGAGRPEFRRINIPNRITWDAQLSPDGKRILLVNDKKLWIVPRSSPLGPGYPGAPRALDTAGVEADWCGPTWSGDGRWIAFNGKEVKKGYQRIYVVSAEGGQPRQVHENNRDVRVVNYRMSLSPRGETLAFTSVDANELHIYTLPVNGGTPTRLVEARAREPVFSPDGTMIAYVEDKALGRAGGGLWVVPAAGGSPTRIAEAENASTPVWSPDGTMLAFVDYAAPKQIHIVPATPQGHPGGRKISLHCPEGFDEVRRLTGWTRDNEIGAIFENEVRCALYAQPVQGGKATFVTHGGFPTQPRWSPDGRRIIHVNNTDGTSGNWRYGALAYVSAEGGDVTTIPLQSETPIRIWKYGVGNRISPDGQVIVFAGQKPPEGIHAMHIWTLPVAGGTPRQLTDAPAAFRDWYPCWSPDGRDIAFVRATAPEHWGVVGKANICVVSAEGGEPRRITSESDRVFDTGPVAWSPDGKSLAYFSRDKDDASDGAIKVVPAEGGEPRVVAEVQRIFANKELAWSPDGQCIAYNAPDNKIKIVSLEDGNVEEIQPDLKDVDIYHLDWSPDGKRFVFCGYAGGGPEFWMAENFLPETPVAKAEPTTVRRIDGDWGTFASLSPDGKYLCDVDRKTETLAVLELATGKVRHVTSKSSDDPRYPLDSAISPDSRQVAYLWWDPNTGSSSLHVTGLDDSGHRLLHEGGYPMPKAWSADGRKILTVVGENNDQKVVWVSASDGSMQEIASFGSEGLGYPGKFDVSPNGRFIAYDRPQTEGDSKRDLFLWDLNEKHEIPLVSHPANDKLLGWTPDGNQVLFASDRAGSWDAWLLQVSDGEPQGFPQLVRPGIGGTGEVRPIGFAPGGSYYYAQEQLLEDVFVARLDLDTGEVLSKPVPVCQTGATACHDWSPDGRDLAYSIRGPGELQTVHVRTLGTGQERVLADNLPYIRWLRWSLDGQSILIDGFRRGDSNGVLYKLDAKTGARTDLVHSETEVLIRPEMSPDGRTLFFDRVDPRSKSTRLMARDLESGLEVELIQIDPPARLTGSALSPDGQRLVLSIVPGRTGADGPVVKIISTAGGPPRELLHFEKSEKAGVLGVAWMPDSRDVLFCKHLGADKKRELWRISTEGGEARRLWSRKTIGHVRVHPDGQRIAFYDRSTPRGVWVMENFLPGTTGGNSR